MGDTTSMNLRIDKNLKKDAETLFESLGINMTTNSLLLLSKKYIISKKITNTIYELLII